MGELRRRVSVAPVIFFHVRTNLEQTVANRFDSAASRVPSDVQFGVGTAFAGSNERHASPAIRSSDCVFRAILLRVR